MYFFLFMGCLLSGGGGGGGGLKSGSLRYIQSTLALRTPGYNRHPDNTDSSQISAKNKLQTFD